VHPTFRPFFRNPHLLTIAGNFWRREIDERRFPGTNRIYQTGDTTRILVREHQPARDARGQILFLHGLEGSCEAGYIKSFAQDALLRGYGVHRTNMRTCGGTESLSDTMYHSGLTGDTLNILQEIQREKPGPLFTVGFSLGGNVVLKLAGELGQNTLLTGVCAASTPIDLATSVRTLDKRSNRLYAQRFLTRLKARIRAKAKASPHLYSDEGLDAITCIWEFDDKYTGPLFGFGNAETYYRTQSAQQFLDKIRIPALVVQAKDDPIVPFEIYSHPAFSTNPFLRLVATEHGGHLGFLSRYQPRFWLDALALDWMDGLLRAKPHGSEQGCGTNDLSLTSV
jgi:predicted alpha/beta-fold hydrolase